MRTIFGKISLLVLATGLAGSAIMAGCSSTPDTSKSTSGNQGSVGLQLDVGGGATINTMHVVVYGNGLGALGAATNIVKDLDVSGISGATAAFTLTLPAGNNYQVKLSSPDDGGTCAGTGTFNVAAGQSSTIAVTMSCASTDTTGSTGVGVTACTPPVVNSVFIFPDSQAVGHTIGLDAAVESGSTIQWTSTGPGTGTFGSSTAASTNFTCTFAGAVTIQLALAKNGCTQSKSYSVTCTGTVSGGGGAGGASSGGAPAGGAPAGGAPAGGAPAGGAPAGGAPAGGAPAGGAPAGGAPAGGAPAGGAPAGGAPAGGAPAGGAPAGGAGGAPSGCPSNSIVNGTGAGQVCSTAFTVDECGLNCAQISKPACITCEEADIAAGNGCYDDASGTNDGSSLLNISAAIGFNGGTSTPAQVIAGEDMLSCIRTSGCAKNSPVFTGCFCGTSASCTTPGSANGPCVSKIQAALGTTDPGTIGARFIDASFAGGVVDQRLACDKTQCASSCF
jgi:hypothetical protein